MIRNFDTIVRACLFFSFLFFFFFLALSALLVFYKLCLVLGFRLHILILALAFSLQPSLSLPPSPHPPSPFSLSAPCPPPLPPPLSVVETGRRIPQFLTDTATTYGIHATKLSSAGLELVLESIRAVCSIGIFIAGEWVS